MEMQSLRKKITPHLHHILLGNSFCYTDNQTNLSINGFQDGGGCESWRDINDCGIGICFSFCLKKKSKVKRENLEPKKSVEPAVKSHRLQHRVWKLSPVWGTNKSS